MSTDYAIQPVTSYTSGSSTPVDSVSAVQAVGAEASIEKQIECLEILQKYVLNTYSYYMERSLSIRIAPTYSELIDFIRSPDYENFVELSSEGYGTTEYTGITDNFTYWLKDVAGINVECSSSIEAKDLASYYMVIQSEIQRLSELLPKEITVNTNDVTRLMRNEQGQYLRNGQWVDYFDISHKDEYERYVFTTYKTYEMAGVSGITKDHQLSLGQLMMALCLARATGIETNSIVPLMEKLAENTAKINALTMLEERLAAAADGRNTCKTKYKDSPMNFTEDDLKTFQQYNDEGYGNSSHTDCASVNDYWNKWLYEIAGVLPSSLGGLTELDANQITECLNYINNELDTLNSVSQELLIELQSETSRRDQAYDLTTAVNKSFNGVMMTVAGNL